MKRVLSKVLASVLTAAMLLTGVQGSFVTPVQAASQKTVVVSTQKELTKALGTKGVSKIVVKTKKAVSFTVKKGNYSAKLEMNAPKATISNGGTWKDVTVTDAKSFTEKAKNNKIVVKDKKLTLTVAKGATVKAITLAKKGASDTLKVNGKVNVLTISAPTTVKISDEGTIKKMTVDAKSAVTLSGSSDTKIAVTMTKNAAKSSVKSAIPVAVKASADVAITLNKGAEGSSVAVKSADANVTLKNSTKESVSVTKADGTKESVGAGEKINTDVSSDNKPDEDKKDEDKKDEDKKDEDKKEDEKQPSDGNSNWSGSTTTPSTPADTTPSLTLDKTEVNLSKWDNAGKVVLTATKKNITGDVEWLSSNPEAATVDKGTVTYQGNGSATITASAGGIQAKCKVTTTDEVLSAAGFQAAVSKATADSSVVLGSDISGDVSLTKSTTGNLTINMKNYTLTGNLKIEESGQDSNYTITLTDNGPQNIGAKITGNLTVNAAHAHVENHIWVQGTSNVVAVADATYAINDKEAKVVLKGKGKLEVKADKRIAPQVVVATEKPVILAGNVKNVSVEKAAEITVDASAEIEKVEIKGSDITEAKPVTVKGSGTVTSLEASAPLEVAVATKELTAAAPVVVSQSATISNVYIENDAAKINVDSAATVKSLSVNSDAVSNIKVEGTGKVEMLDITQAKNDVTIDVVSDVAKNIKAVVATSDQDEAIADNSNIKSKVKTPKSLNVSVESVNTAYFVGQTPVITGASIRVVYSDDKVSDSIAVTDKMLDLSAVKKDVAGTYVVKVSYAGLSENLVTLKYSNDSVVSAAYAAGSMKKLTYTRTDKLDPTGAVITLSYASGKTEQITDTSKMTFKDTAGNVISDVSPARKGKYTIAVYYGKIEAGSQEVDVNPIYYTVKLDAMENTGAPGRKETVEIEEFTTLNNAEIGLTETLTPTAHENRMWTFVKWVQKGDSDAAAYSWDTQVTSDLSLIGYWNVIYPEKDKITISVNGTQADQGSIYTVYVEGIHDFFNNVTGVSSNGGAEVVKVKYGVAGTSSDDMTPYNENASFEANKKYEIVYYTEDGPTYDGNWASIFVIPKNVVGKFENASNGIITNCDGIINAPYQIIHKIPYKAINIAVRLKSVPAGVNQSNCGVSCTNVTGNTVTIQLHNKDNSRLQAGQYGIDLTYDVLDENGTSLEKNTVALSYSFNHVFTSKEGLSWSLRLNENNDTRILSVPYDENKKTAADYLEMTIAAGSSLEYKAVSAESYTKIDSLAVLTVTPDCPYTICVTDQDGQKAYFIFAATQNVNIENASNGIITNCDGIIDVPYTIVTNIPSKLEIVSLELTSVPEGADIENCELSCPSISDNYITLQLHNRDNSNLVKGTYGIRLTYRLLAADQKLIEEKTITRECVFKHVFTSKEGISWESRLNEDYNTRILKVPYFADKATAADYLDMTIEEESVLEYRAASDESYTKIDFLTELTVQNDCMYTIRVTDQAEQEAYFIFCAGDMGVQFCEPVRDVNLNCIKMVCSERLDGVFSFNVLDVTYPNSPIKMDISQSMGEGSTYYIWLNTAMEADHHYKVELSADNVRGTMIAEFVRLSDDIYKTRNTVDSAAITGTNQITINMTNAPTKKLYCRVMEEMPDKSGWARIEASYPAEGLSKTFTLTTKEDLTGKTIRLCICDEDIAEAYDKILSGDVTGDSGSVVRSVSDVNTNCIKVECSEPTNLNLAVVDVANSTGMSISQILGTGNGNDHVIYIWLANPMVAGATYNVLLVGEPEKSFSFTRKSDADYQNRNSVVTATITGTNQITVNMEKAPTRNLHFVVLQKGDGENNWNMISVERPEGTLSDTFVLTTAEDLTGKTIRLCICDDDIAEAYDATPPIYSGDNGSGS